MQVDCVKLKKIWTDSDVNPQLLFDLHLPALRNSTFKNYIQVFLSNKKKKGPVQSLSVCV